MKRSTGGYRAMHFDQIAGVGTRDAGFADKHIYVIDNVPGLYRRVAKPAVSDFASAGVVPAFFGDGALVYLKLDVALEDECNEAGIMFSRDWRQGPMETPEDVAGANARARELHKNPPADLLTGATDTATNGTATGTATTTEEGGTRKRAAGTRIRTTAPLPSVTNADGTPLEGSLAAEGLGASSPPPAPVSIHQQIADADGAVPPPDSDHEPPPSEPVPPGQVDPATGMAPPGSVDW